MDAGALDIKRSTNGQIQGFYDPITGKSFLIADALTAKTVTGVLMHEVGIHMAADGSMNALFDRAGKLMESNDPFMARVRERMKLAGEDGNEEAAAYIAEEFVNDEESAPKSVKDWISSVYSAIRAWMFRKGIVITADHLTPADIAAVAKANVKALADGTMAPASGFAFSEKERLAPNGKPSNLTPGQYAQVRTPEFKAWFGDWESVARQANNRAVIERALSDKQWQERTLIAQGNDADPSGKLSEAFGFSITKQYITPDDIRKTDKRHGEGNESFPDQIGLTHDDYVKMIEVLRNPQTYRITTSKNGKPSAEFGYRFSDGTYVVAEVEVSEPNAVSLKTAWKKITGRNHAGATAYPVRTTSDNAASADIVHSDSLLVNPDTVSKAVDENGEPLVVFHGTSGNFSIFDGGRASTASMHATAYLGHYFSESTDVANDFVPQWTDQTKWPMRPEVRQGGNVMPIYLAISNPYRMPLSEFRSMVPNGRSKAGVDQARALREKLIGEGYDGIHISGDKELSDSMAASEWAAGTWIAFRPTQIKSAIGNNGQFDPKNPDIRFSRNATLQKVGDVLNESFNYPGTVSKWHTTVGSMYNLAERNQQCLVAYGR